MVARPIISYPEALKIIQTQAGLAQSTLRVEKIQLVHARGRITAFAVKSPEVLPTFANSAMDGFAVRAHETKMASLQSPLRLPILGNLAAGDHPVISPNDHGAWEIMTGAPFPEGFDACVRIEDIEVVKNAQGQPSHIQITKPAEKFQNRREIGEDFQQDEILIPAGQRLRAEDILCLASVGVLEIEVLSRPRVAIISTGKELVPIHETPAPGKIRNSSGIFLQAALQARHCEVTHLATVLDDPADFKKIIEQIRDHQFDLVLTTGAISMGKYDFVASALQELQAEFYFKKVAMRPGKPILFGRLTNGAFLMGLPGNPISGAVGLRFFVDPFLRALQLQKPEAILRLPLAEDTFKTPEATAFLKGRIENGHHGSQVLLHKQQRPSLMHPLLTSDIWIALSQTDEKIPAGTLVDVYSFLGKD